MHSCFSSSLGDHQFLPIPLKMMFFEVLKEKCFFGVSICQAYKKFSKEGVLSVFGISLVTRLTEITKNMFGIVGHYFPQCDGQLFQKTTNPHQQENSKVNGVWRKSPPFELKRENKLLSRSLLVFLFPSQDMFYLCLFLSTCSFL